MMRAFIAIRVTPTGTLAELSRRLSDLGSAVRPGSLQNLHLTLRFLGDIEEDLADCITTALRNSVSGVSRFEMRLVGLGVFPTISRPRVVWVGGEDGGRVAAIVDNLALHLSELGFEPLSDPWQPHITVARIKARPPRTFFDLLRDQQGTDYGCMSVTSVELMRSRLDPRGAVYSVVSSVPLG